MDLPPVLKETETRQLPQRMKKTEEKHKRSNKPRRGIVPFVTSQTDLEKSRKHYEKKTGPSHFSVVQLRNIGAYYC